MLLLHEVSVSIILQNLAQLKALFEKEWESIVGNCDELLYLGGNEQSTHKFISELMGKATIDMNTYGKSNLMVNLHLQIHPSRSVLVLVNFHHIHSLLYKITVDTI